MTNALSNPIAEAAAILDDIASGQLTEGDFYLMMEEAGIQAGELCILLMRNTETYSKDTFNAITDAAECLKDICIASDNSKLMAALSSAKGHSERLYQIMDKQ